VSSADATGRTVFWPPQASPPPGMRRPPRVPATEVFAWVERAAITDAVTVGAALRHPHGVAASSGRLPAASVRPLTPNESSWTCWIPEQRQAVVGGPPSPWPLPGLAGGPVVGGEVFTCPLPGGAAGRCPWVADVEASAWQ
jgi:hypothetical protein